MPAAQVVDVNSEHRVEVRFINLPQEFWGQGKGRFRSIPS